MIDYLFNFILVKVHLIQYFYLLKFIVILYCTAYITSDELFMFIWENILHWMHVVFCKCLYVCVVDSIVYLFYRFTDFFRGVGWMNYLIYKLMRERFLYLYYLDLYISPFSLVRFCFMYFEVLLISKSFLELLCISD